MLFYIHVWLTSISFSIIYINRFRKWQIEFWASKISSIYFVTLTSIPCLFNVIAKHVIINRVSGIIGDDLFFLFWIRRNFSCIISYNRHKLNFCGTRKNGYMVFLAVLLCFNQFFLCEIYFSNYINMF